MPAINTRFFSISTEILLGATKAPTWRPSGACYSCSTYNWRIRSPQFTDPTMLPDHSHVLNIVTPLYLYRQLWMVAHISALRPYNQAAWSELLQRYYNVQIMQLCRFEISAPMKITQAGINTSPFPLRKGVQTWLQKTLAVHIWLLKTLKLVITTPL